MCEHTKLVFAFMSFACIIAKATLSDCMMRNASRILSNGLCMGWHLAWLCNLFGVKAYILLLVLLSLDVGVITTPLSLA